MAFLGKVANIVGPAIELKNCIYEPVKRELGYYWWYDDNVKNLKDEARKLEDKRAGLQMRVDEAENNARIVLPEVKSWFREVTDIQAKMDEIQTEIATIQNGGFSRSLHRRSVSKRVEVIAEAMKELQKSCGFEIISVPPPPVASAPIKLGSALEFESRKHIEDGIMTSLRDGEVYKVGICGMGGVGKTTMAKRIMHRAREEHLFEEIVMVVVSQNVDMLRIQDDIARSFGLHLGEGSLHVKAHTLRTRLSESTKRWLIVVDDVWGYLKLDDLGIPACQSGCKVLITSRNQDIFNDLNVNKIHKVNVLSEDEAWYLFKLNVGSCIDHPDMVLVARQVLTECKGLPIALVTVGSTLKNKEDTRVWNDLLHQLKGSNPITLPKVLDDVYKPLRLSYKFLENKQAKCLFLLCCLYREDGDIPLDELTFYALGLGILKGINRLEQARNRVCLLVETLKSCFLLMESKYENHVKMHDVVRDIALFIASDKKWIISDGESNDCTWISPYIEGRAGIHADAGSRVFQNLHLLWIDYYRDKELNVNDYLFGGMKELKVLSIEFLRLTRLPETTRLLENLQTLVLESCDSLESITVVGELVNLKILVCSNCGSIESLPVEIGRLSGLKLLELSNCYKLEKIPPGIISKLKKLEELIVWNCFDGWEAKNMGKESENALLSELEHLSSLCRLKIQVKDSRLAAEQIHPPPKLKEYEIIVGVRQFNFYYGQHLIEVYELCKRKMKLVLPHENIISAEWIRKLVGSVEYLYIEGDGSKYLDFGAAQDLRVLVFNDCSTVKTLVSSTTTDMVFPRLEILHLEELSELKVICHIDGPPMSSNSSNNLQGIKSIIFPVLEEMHVEHCQRLESFVCITSPDDSDISVPCKPQKFEFDSLRKLEVGGYSGSMCRNWCPMITAIFSRLSSLTISGISNMKSSFPYSVAQNLHNLRELRIQYCSDMVGVIEVEDDACGGQTPPTPTPLLPNLETIYLSCLKKLKSFCECKHSLEFPSLTSLYISDCDSMEEFTSGHVSTPILPHIQIGYEKEDILNISKGVNASLKQQWVKRQQEEHIRQLEESSVQEKMKAPVEIMVQKRVEEVDAWLSIGPPNESQLQNLRLIEAEEEIIRWLEGSSLQQKMKAPVEFMESMFEESKSVEESRKRYTGVSIGLENEFRPKKRRRIGMEVENKDEVIKLLDSMIENCRKLCAELSTGNNEFQSGTHRRIEMEVDNVEETHSEIQPEIGKGIVTKVKMSRHNTHFTQGEPSAAPKRRRQLEEHTNHRYTAHPDTAQSHRSFEDAGQEETLARSSSSSPRPPSQ